MIRVASYNMRKAIGTDRRRRPERTIEVLNELDADVIALQEADRRFGSRASAIPLALLEEHSDYKPVEIDNRAGSIGWHGNALLVRKGVEVLEHHLFHLPSLEPRGAVLADVDARRRRCCASSACISTCPACGGGSRRRRSSPISHERDGEPPTVLMGDLNEWSTRGGCLRDFAADHDFAPCGRSFHARRPIASLDRIMVSRDLEVVDSGAHRTACSRRASDHLPIWAELQRRSRRRSFSACARVAVRLAAAPALGGVELEPVAERRGGRPCPSPHIRSPFGRGLDEFHSTTTPERSARIEQDHRAVAAHPAMMADHPVAGIIEHPPAEPVGARSAVRSRNLRRRKFSPGRADPRRLHRGEHARRQHVGRQPHLRQHPDREVLDRAVDAARRRHPVIDVVDLLGPLRMAADMGPRPARRAPSGRRG